MLKLRPLCSTPHLTEIRWVVGHSGTAVLSIERLLVEGVEKGRTPGDDLARRRDEGRFLVVIVAVVGFDGVVVTLCHSYVNRGRGYG